MNHTCLGGSGEEQGENILRLERTVTVIKCQGLRV